jgi:hypothetical protein
MTPAVTTGTTSPGGSVGYALNLQSIGGFSQNVSLSVTGLPAGASYSFSNNPSFVDALLASASTLWVNTSSATPVGSSTIMITGTSDSGIAHTQSVTLNVVSSGSQDFRIEMTPSAQYVSAGKSPATYSIKVVPAFGFTGMVVLSANTVPGAVLLGWNGNTPVTAQNPSVSVLVGGSNPGTATLTVATTSTNPPGVYALTVTGTSGSLSHTAVGTLDIDLFSATGTTSAALYPGTGPMPITVSLTDPYNYSVTITGLAVSVAQDSQGNVIDANGTTISGCMASWFTFQDTPLSSTNTLSLSSGTPQTLPAVDDPSISEVNAPVNQDKCENHQLMLNFIGTAQH